MIYTDTLQTVVLIAGAIVVTSMCKSHLDIYNNIMIDRTEHNIRKTCP